MGGGGGRQWTPTQWRNMLNVLEAGPILYSGVHDTAGAVLATIHPIEFFPKTLLSRLDTGRSNSDVGDWMGNWGNGKVSMWLQIQQHHQALSGLFRKLFCRVRKGVSHYCREGNGKATVRSSRERGFAVCLKGCLTRCGRSVQGHAH